MEENYKTKLPNYIKFLLTFVFILIFTFTIWTDSDYFLYLFWNIFLAFLPFYISSILLWYKNKNKNKTYKIFFILGIFFWLIFFPNTPYLITDLIHIGANSTVPILFDVILLLSCAYIGIYLTVFSLLQIEELLSSWYTAKKTNSIILFLVFLSSLGIYLGRFLRWNSWDIFSNPKLLLVDIVDIFSNPLNNINAYITIISFFVLIILSFYILKKFIKNK